MALGIHDLPDKWRKQASEQWHADFNLSSESGIVKRYESGDIQRAICRCADELQAELAGPDGRRAPDWQPDEK